MALGWMRGLVLAQESRRDVLAALINPFVAYLSGVHVCASIVFHGHHGVQCSDALMLGWMPSLGFNRHAEPLQPEDIYLLDREPIFGRYLFTLPSSVQNNKTSTGKGNI